MFLLDTMVLSEKGKRRKDFTAAAWLDRHASTTFFISTISLAEIYSGIERKRKVDQHFSRRLDDWAVSVRDDFMDRTLAVTTEVAIRWAQLSAKLGRRDLDLFIAATALEHDLTVATRNVRHFETTGVKFFNPYEA